MEPNLQLILHCVRLLCFLYAAIGEQRTDSDELDVDSNHLPITFSLRAEWSTPRIKKQKIETWNLRSNNWEQFRKVLEKKLTTIWSSSLPEIMFD